MIEVAGDRSGAALNAAPPAVIFALGPSPALCPPGVVFALGTAVARMATHPRAQLRECLIIGGAGALFLRASRRVCVGSALGQCAAESSCHIAASGRVSHRKISRHANIGDGLNRAAQVLDGYAAHLTIEH